jgi:hypothetical protein
LVLLLGGLAGMLVWSGWLINPSEIVGRAFNISTEETVDCDNPGTLTALSARDRAACLDAQRMRAHAASLYVQRRALRGAGDERTAASLDARAKDLIARSVNLTPSRRSVSR